MKGVSDLEQEKGNKVEKDSLEGEGKNQGEVREDNGERVEEEEAKD